MKGEQLNNCFFQLHVSLYNVQSWYIYVCVLNIGGPSSKDPKKHVFLFVMPLMNKGTAIQYC